MFYYHRPIWAAGYSGFVVYTRTDARDEVAASYWMIPGTWEYDWDNR